jgi:hypothetical protein
LKQKPGCLCQEAGTWLQVKKWLIDRGGRIVRLSPDLNPIENLWFELKRAVHMQRQRISKIWKNQSKIPPNVFSNPTIKVRY